MIIPKNKNFKLSFENWFTSYNLIVSLKNHGILGVGTVRSNRLSGCQFENDKNLKKSGRGSYDTKIEQILNVRGITLELFFIL